MTFRVIVEADVCENNGVCERLAPDIFALGEDERLPVQVLLDPIDDDRAPPPTRRLTRVRSRRSPSSTGRLQQRESSVSASHARY
jgi:ferredoxin